MTPVQEHIEAWLADKRHHHYSPRSIETYGYRIQRLVLFLEGEGVSDIEHCDPALLTRFWSTLTADEQAFSLHSLGSERRTIQSFFAYLKQSGVITSDPSEVLQDRRRVRKQAAGESKPIRRQVKAWQDHLRTLNHSPKTLTVYALQLRTLLQFLDERGIQDLRRVTPTLMRDYYHALLSRTQPTPFRVSNLRGKVRATKSLFKHLTESGEVILNPADVLREPKAETLPRGILSVSEMAKLLDMPDLIQPEGIRDRALLEVLYATGIRLGEVTALTLEDLDLTGGLLSIRQGKGGDRVVPLTVAAGKFVAAYLTQARPLLLERCHGKPYERRLWLNRWGSPLASGLIGRLVSDYAIQSGIERRVSPHLLRHSAATHLLNNGANLRMVQELLGHVRTSTTQIYTRVTLGEVKRTHADRHPRRLDLGLEPTSTPVRVLYSR